MHTSSVQGSPSSQSGFELQSTLHPDTTAAVVTPDLNSEKNMLNAINKNNIKTMQKALAIALGILLDSYY